MRDSNPRHDGPKPSGLTPRNQLGSFPTKNDNAVTEFG